MTNEDFARLSRVFNAGCNLHMTQDYRINEWLKQRLADTHDGCTCRTGGDIEKDPDCPIH